MADSYHPARSVVNGPSGGLFPLQRAAQLAVVGANIRRGATMAVVALVGMVLISLVAWPIWKPLLVATVLAGSISGLQERLSARLRGHRSLAALTLTLAVVLLILIPLAWLAVLVVREAAEVIEYIRNLTRESQGGLIRQLPAYMQAWIRDWMASLPGGVRELTSKLGGGTGWALTTALEILSTASHLTFHLVLMLIALFFLLRDGPAVMTWLDRYSPLGAEQTRQLLRSIRNVARTVVGSNLATGTTQAVVATIGYLIAGAPSPFLFGLLTLFTSFVPSVGTALVAVPVTVLILVAGHPWAALFLGAWSLLVVGLVDNVLRPFLIKGRAGLHGALVFFALLGGILAFGSLGLLLGPLSLSIVAAAFRMRGAGVQAA